MKSYIVAFITLITLCTQPVIAQVYQSPYEYNGQWYIGKDGGIPFGVSSFSSFGSGNNKLGWSAGMYGGYYFNTAFGLEAYMLTGKVKLTSQSQYNIFWLGKNDYVYIKQPSDLVGWRYDNLKGTVKMQIYGVRGNINILGLFNETKASRWMVGLLPQIALVGTKASFRTVDTNTKVIKHKTEWHMGVGGNLTVVYKIAKHWSLGIYSGITYLTGKSLDSTPKFANRDNYIWDSGVRINFIFSHKPRVIKKAEKYIGVIEDALHIEPVYREETIVEDNNGNLQAIQVKEFPAITFPKNSVMIEHNQAYKINRMVRVLKKNPNAQILISGYADDADNLEQNIRRAKLRSQTVKRQLMSSNIKEELIQIIEMNDGKVQQNGNCVVIDFVPQQ